MDCMSRIPKGWLQTPIMGSLIRDIFYPFKTILDSRFDKQMPVKDRFNVNKLKEILKEKSINIVIDLTVGDKYYKGGDIKDISHIKIRKSSPKELPTLKEVKKFNKAINLSLKYDRSYKIAVFCTHGYNRTGFMIVSYLLLEQQIPLPDAIRLFAEAREPGIYNHDYLNKLIFLYQPNLQLTFPSPPSWEPKKKRKSKIPDASSDIKTDEMICPRKTISPEKIAKAKSPDKRDRSRKRKSRTPIKTQEPKLKEIESERPSKINRQATVNKREGMFPEFYLRISTVQPFTNRRDLEFIMKQLQILMETTIYGFIGYKYKPLTKETLSKYRSTEFYHTWRTNGKRYLLFINRENEIFMIDENNRYYKVHNLKFPHPHIKDKQLIGTILDGELVIDIRNDKQFFRYLVSDIYAVNKKRVWENKLTSRLGLIEEFITFPRVNIPASDKEKEPFKIVLKTFSEKMHIQMTWKTLRNDIPHGMTGLIFHPYNDISYAYLHNASVFIWAPHNFKFAKFKLKSRYDKRANKYIGELYLRDLLIPFYEIKYISPSDRRMYDNSIVRCRLDPNKSKWQIIDFDPEDRLAISKWDITSCVDDFMKPVPFEDLTIDK